jgi:hypothetical protein
MTSSSRKTSTRQTSDGNIADKRSANGAAMSGRTLREAIAIALEAVPSVEFASGDEKERRALREFLVRWIKDYARVRGIIFEDLDFELELREAIATLRR